MSQETSEVDHGVNTARITITTSCRDTDHLPKVSNAGQFVGEDNSLQVMHNGVLVGRDCYDGAWMTEIIQQLHGHHEPQEEVVFDTILNRLKTGNTTPTMLELGSYWCYYSLWFLNEFPNGRTHCVEPDINNLEIGRKNFALNNRTGIFHNALIDEVPSDPTSFFCYSDSTTRAVPTESLDSLIAKFGLSRIDILHSDIQGFELPLLKGAFETLKSGVVRFVVLSTHHSSISGDDFTHERCLLLLKEAGAHIIAEHNVFESFSGDGLIVASFDPQDAELVVHVSRAQPWESLFGNNGAGLRDEVVSRRNEVIELNKIAALMQQELQTRDNKLQEAAGAYSALEVAYSALEVAYSGLDTRFRTTIHEAHADQRQKAELLRAAQQLNAELLPKIHELEAMKASKLYRWSSIFRKMYYKLRRIGKYQ